MSRFLLIILSLFCLSTLLPAQTQDSIPETDLHEVVVTSDRSWIKDGVHNFIPSKKEKQLSDSPETLIGIMNLPILKSEGGSISTIGGEPVTIFINGVPANNIDLATFNTKDVKRVEYIAAPTDPKFMGGRNVLNFIMAEYLVGGVTKAYLFQQIPNRGIYQISSKLVYKRMTFGASVSYRYNKERGRHRDEIFRYEDIFLDGNLYENLIRESRQDLSSTDRNVSASINAIYSTDRFRATHTVGLGRQRNPGSGYNSRDIWSADIFDGSTSFYTNDSRNLSPQVSGHYYWQISNKFTAQAQWLYAYSRNHSGSTSLFSGNTPVSNSISEDVNSLQTNVRIVMQPTSNLYLQLGVTPTFGWYDTHYSGNSHTSEHQQRRDVSADFMVYWLPNPAWTVVLTPGIFHSDYNVGGERIKTTMPTAQVYIGWNPNSRFSLQGSLNYYFFSPKPSDNNPVMVKSSDLLWVVGNPNLKPECFRMAELTGAYNPARWLSIGTSLIYNHFDNLPADSYIAAPADMGGMIKSVANFQKSDEYGIRLSFSSSLFENRLSLSFSPSWKYQQARGVYRVDYNSLSCTSSIGYILGNFRLSTFYKSPSRGYSVSGMEKKYEASQWDISATYGYRDLMVSLVVEDILNKRHISSYDFNAGVYSYSGVSESIGRKLRLTVSYTFSYGKKINRSIDISSPTELNSTIISNQDK
ncbi:MAG: outer membrane beta-barrel protein [Muribaculaceae bacterium]|nr:outer membrane beta-barrel protein [Muribaculaceae bacterium]